MSAGGESRDAVRIWRPAALAGVEVWHIRELPEGQTHLLEGYLIGAYTSEHAEAQYRQRQFTLTDGMVQLSEPGELVRCIRQHRPWSAFAVLLEPAAVERLAEEAGIAGTPHFTQPAAHDAELFRSVADLADAAMSGDALAQQSALVETLALALDLYGERRPADPGADRSAVARARDYLHAEWRGHVTLDALARAALSSKFHLVRQFRAAYGLPPHQYLLQLRIAKARRMLAQGMPISRAAVECGFSAQSHLHRHFVRSVGVTPGQYRSATRVKT